jgi:hypothetical protein
MEMELLVTTDKDYQEMMIFIFELMNKGVSNLISDEIEELKLMTKACERYEDEVLNLKVVKQ